MAMWWAEGAEEEQDQMEGMGRNSSQKEQQISYLNKEQGVLLRQKQQLHLFVHYLHLLNGDCTEEFYHFFNYLFPCPMTA